jgi:hypothetical protein
LLPHIVEQSRLLGACTCQQQFFVKVCFAMKHLIIALLASIALPSQADLEARLREAVAGRQTTVIPVAGGVIRVAFAEGDFGRSQAEMLDWVRYEAKAISTFYGALPVPEIGLVMEPADGRGVTRGVTFGGDAPVIRVAIGRASSPALLKNDWVLAHELVHTALPVLPRRQHWLEEGIATYVEPIARAQAGQLSEREVWSDMVDGMPKGLPVDGDRGLDFTPTWGRTYWGGALFCLVADVRIRQQTGNRFGLQQALRAINRQTRGMTQERSTSTVLALGDAATGTTVLSDLYAEWRDQPVAPNLSNLWRDLGVSRQGVLMSFDPKEPLAAIRAAITQPLPSE